MYDVDDNKIIFHETPILSPEYSEPVSPGLICTCWSWSVVAWAAPAPGCWSAVSDYSYQ